MHAKLLFVEKYRDRLHGRDRVEIGSTGEVHGDISTLRISIGEGAQIHSKVEIDSPGQFPEQSTASAKASTQRAGNGPSGGHESGRGNR